MTNLIIQTSGFERPQKMHYIVGIFLVLILALTGCSQQNDNAGNAYVPETVPANKTVPEYNFAVHPLHNPTRLFEVFNPLIEYLNQNISEAHFVLEASKDYASFDEKLQNQSVAFALPNPYQTLMSIDQNYRVFAKMGDDENFKGIILVRKDSGIQVPSDLKGKAVSYPAPTALAATMMPQYFLQTHGVDVNKDIANKYVGSQESSIMNVFLGTVSAGATWPPPWKSLSDENPELKEQLKIIWETASLPNNSVLARQDIPPSLVNQVQELMVNLHNTPEGQEILSKMYLSKFETANNATYESVKAFMKEFEQKVRPL